MKKKNKKNKLLIDYSEEGKDYKIFMTDFEKVKYYCLNECMGIQFLTSAEMLKKLTENLLSLNYVPPFKLEDFLSKKSISSLKKKGVFEEMKKNFGTADLKLIVPLVIKQTYNFLHKV